MVYTKYSNVSHSILGCLLNKFILTTTQTLKRGNTDLRLGHQVVKVIYQVKQFR